MEIHPAGSSCRKAYREESSKERCVAFPADSSGKRRCRDLQEGEEIIGKLDYTKYILYYQNIPL